MLLTELITNAAVRGGIPVDNDLLKQLQGNPALNVEVDTTIADAIQNNLKTIQEAQKHPDVIKHFRATLLAPADSKFAELANEFGLTPEEIASLEGEKNTYSKFDVIKGVLKDKLASSGKKTDSPEAKAQIEALQAQLKTLEAEKAQAVKDADSRIEQFKYETAKSKEIFSHKWPDHYSNPKIQETVYNAALDEELATVKAKTKLVNGEIILVNADDETLPYYENNAPVSFKELSDRVKAKNNLIQVAPDPGQQQQFTSTPPAENGGKPLPSYQQKIIAANQKALQEMEQNV